MTDLHALANSVARRKGWDFSCMRADRDPVPWNYSDVVRSYARPGGRALDIGTGGGEKLLAMSGFFKEAVGIDSDPAMAAAANANLAGN